MFLFNFYFYLFSIVFFYCFFFFCVCFFFFLFVFFFQAEDGIRDLTVTGVQTCALPILPGGKILRPRVDALNTAVDGIGAKHGAHVVDLWDDCEFLNPRLWGIDRLHLSPAGHRRVAGHVLTALGVTCDASWLAAPPPPEDMSWMSRKAADAR